MSNFEISVLRTRDLRTSGEYPKVCVNLQIDVR